ncbi:MAG: resolvase [Phycisphaerae bacterium]|nr:resolvase [Phycisphaerae bacterium]MBM92265.1 resolvase [Phycisphaerae bacterium]
MKTIRCAVYTRKSNEEGLDLAFNSLDAQLEAGFDYIKSQKHEGWEAVKTIYSDGGFSGGTMKRPGLTQLLDDIDKGRIDVVVVYKVDRLSRSLSDFAKMMELFDEKQVSFVSVTQQFNTSTSMGRLTMNMLLSFAQFEREVSGERIRDKIAATKKKGYWVGGTPPLGYRLQREDESKGIFIIPREAELIRAIFTGYAEHQSLVEVATELNEHGYTTKRWTSKNGRVHGGKPLTTKYIHGILTNRLYIGKITHSRNGKTDVYEGLHQPIIDQETWDAAHQIMKKQEKSELHRWTHPHLLKGKLRTSDGFAMSPSSTHRPLTKRSETKQKRLVRYYISQKAIKHGFKTCPVKSINAEHLDELVRGLVLRYINKDDLVKQPQSVRDRWIRRVIESVTLDTDQVAVSLLSEQIDRLRSHKFKAAPSETPAYPSCLQMPKIEDCGKTISLTLRIQIKKLDGRRLLLSPDGSDLIIPSNPVPQQHIVDAIGQAYRWHNELIRSGTTIRAYAEQHRIARSRMIELLPLTQLGPEALRHALAGTLPSTITLDDLIAASKRLDWDLQVTELGIRSAS